MHTFFEGNDLEILPAHYTWKVVENGLTIKWVMWCWERLAVWNILENFNNFFSAKNHCKIKVRTILVCVLHSRNSLFSWKDLLETNTLAYSSTQRQIKNGAITFLPDGQFPKGILPNPGQDLLQARPSDGPTGVTAGRPRPLPRHRGPNVIKLFMFVTREY